MGSAALAGARLASAAASAMRPYPIPCRILSSSHHCASAAGAAGGLAVTLTGPFSRSTRRCRNAASYPRRDGPAWRQTGPYGAICRSEGRNRGLVATGCDFWADGPGSLRAGMLDHATDRNAAVPRGCSRRPARPGRRISPAGGSRSSSRSRRAARSTWWRGCLPIASRSGGACRSRSRTAPAAGGNIAAALVAKAAPDGYTILFTATGVAINQSLMANPGIRHRRARADRVSVDQLDHAGGQSGESGGHAQGVRRRAPDAELHLRHRRHRLGRAPHRRIPVQGAGEDRGDPHAVPGRAAGEQRAAGQSHRPDLGRVLGCDPADPAGPAARAWRCRARRAAA